METVKPASWLEWAAAGSPREGQGESGDRCVVRFCDDGVLLAVVDGLGHGSEAAKAADAATSSIEQFAGEHLDELIQRCHEALRRTRGVVMGIAFIKPAAGTIEWLSVGDVEGVLARGDRRQPLRIIWLGQDAGVVGDRIPVVTPRLVAIEPGDMLALATDGVRTDFAQLRPGVPPDQLAERILSDCGRKDDDALILVARYLGGAE